MKKITIKKCYKSFRLFDFHVFDEKVEKNFQFPYSNVWNQ